MWFNCVSCVKFQSASLHTVLWELPEYPNCAPALNFSAFLPAIVMNICFASFPILLIGINKN
ncbi:MAG TPA: hypothetical protein VEL11_14950, partial [Candidatus Bathyarchaeia archaeon]|nr:hypothetical protein [Candidatus Bathyarchaeia archaeon]